MGDGYTVAPAELHGVAGELRAEGEHLTAASGLPASVDAGRSTGEIAAAVAWLTAELDAARASFDALADKVERAAENYVTQEHDATATYGAAAGARAGAAAGQGGSGGAAQLEAR